MEDEKRSGGGESSRASSSFVKSGDRQVFSVELRPGETTIVSWKKLVRDANKVNGSAASASAPAEPAPAPAPEAPVNAHPRLESRMAPVQVQQAGDEANDEPATNRFSAVIEKIERLYMGKDSSDDEDMNDIPDDDQYDTEDSFIDDAELDEYFQVDNSAIKHDGFFVNRGKLERIEHAVPANEQPKKRRRKDFAKSNGENADGRAQTKQQKTAESKDTGDKLKLGVPLTKDPGGKLKDMVLSSDTSHHKHHEKNAYAQSRLPSSKLVVGDDFESSVRAKEKNGIREQPDTSIFEGKFSEPMTKSSLMHRKDGSSARSKSSLLDKAIRELEKMVAESRPPALENQDADNSSQAIKRRLPREVKMKLGKVARLAGSHGKFSKELLNRLMSILGHIIQLRTLKRNLKIMVSTGLSDGQENEDRFQLIKKEVVDMIKVRVSSMDLKALEQQAGASDDFQGTATEVKEASKKKFNMEAALEDKICDLYDLYVDGLDEDAGPQIRKLYAQLAQLWPNGFMDNHGIKRAICRSKERRRASFNRNKDQEKINRKKVLVPKQEEPGRNEGSSVLRGTDSGGQSAAGFLKQGSAATVGAMRTASPSPLHPPNFDKPKQDKIKGSASSSADEARFGDTVLAKKKAKRKPEIEPEEAQFHPMKLNSQHGEDRPKSIKPGNIQSSVLSSIEQSS